MVAVIAALAVLDGLVGRGRIAEAADTQADTNKQ